MSLSSKVAIFNAPEEPFQLQEVAVKALEPREVLIKNEYVTLCRSDLLTYSGKRKEKTPTLLGHEIVGRIAAFSDSEPASDVRGVPLQLGDRVTWGIYASAPDDPLSKLGMPQKAADLFKYGHETITPDSHLHGGLGEYIVLRKNTPIIKLNEEIPLPVAALINCAVSTVAGALRLSGDLSQKNVLISGVGMLGIVACAMSKALGAAQVIALDTNAARLEKAQGFGADACLLMSDEQPDVKANAAAVLGDSFTIHNMIDFSGAPQAMENGIDLLSIGGTAVWIGATYPQRQVQINAEQVVRKILTIKGLHNYNEHDLIAAVDFITQYHHVYPFEQLVQGAFSLDQVEAAFQYALENNPFRVGIQF